MIILRFFLNLIKMKMTGLLDFTENAKILIFCPKNYNNMIITISIIVLVLN